MKGFHSFSVSVHIVFALGQLGENTDSGAGFNLHIYCIY